MSSLLRGIFLTSEKPEDAAKFYREVAGLEFEQIGSEGGYVYWKVDRDGLQLAIHDAKLFANYTYPARSESNLTHLYFKIESQEAFLSHLKAMRIDPLAIDAIVVTVRDPDGRIVMFGTA